MPFLSNRNLDHLTIEAGKHHEKKDDPHQQIRRVTKILMHESYDSDLIDNDITLFKLDKPFILNEYVNIVCLPEVVVADGANCMVTGWGDTKSEIYLFFLYWLKIIRIRLSRSLYSPLHITRSQGIEIV